MHRIVHLDLKGAPLKIGYIEKVLRCIKNWGATGILIEWEDTFPYNMELEVIGSIRGCGGDGMYTREEVMHLLQFAKMNGLEPIQLVQTMGHMEFVLKHPMFKNMRENPNSPTSLCPCSAQAQSLVRAMILQLLRVQPLATYIHIGADEVWCYGVCEACRMKIQMDDRGAPVLYLEHIQNLAVFIKTERPDLTVLFWDDNLRSLDVELLKSFKLGEVLQPVLWYYNSLKDFNIDRRLLEKYSQAFPCIWAASAFKGANGSCKMISPVSHYHSNHVGWLNTIQSNPDVHFRGIILTGWSRFDHFATLCELLPVSMPSLANCLQLVTKFDGFNSSASNILLLFLINELKEIQADEQLLRAFINELCRIVVSDKHQTNFVLKSLSETKSISSEIQQLDRVQWPGHELASCIETYATIKSRMETMLVDDHVTTWLNPWQVQNNYTNPVQVNAIYQSAVELLRFAESLKRNIEVYLQDITGKRSVDEWIHTNCTTVINKLKHLCGTASIRANTEAGVTPGASCIGYSQ